MVVDYKNLIYGGLTFSLGDFTAMVAVNHPNVVLTTENVKFLKPIVLGDILISEGKVIENNKFIVKVDVKITRNSMIVFSEEFFCKFSKNMF